LRGLNAANTGLSTTLSLFFLCEIRYSHATEILTLLTHHGAEPPIGEQVNISALLGGLGLMALVASIACSEQDSATVVLQTDQVTALEVAQATPAQTDSDIALDVYKSPTCGCCGKWVDHAAERDFTLAIHHPEDLNRLKSDHGIAPQYQSCHTAVSAEGYVFEGHIPARYIHEFLGAPPVDARGLAVPGMPVGSPGMEVEDRFMPYQILLLKSDGSTTVFAEVSDPGQQYN
jgi:hypothetical protein